MKKKLLCFAFAILFVFSMTSCLLIDDVSDLYFGDSFASSNGSNDNTTINVTGGDTNNITINTPESAELVSANKALLSAVSVYCNFKRSSYGFVTNEVTGAGSGVIYKLDKEKGDAYIITNYHVVYDAYCNTKNHISNDISIYLYGMEATKYAIPATYIGGSMNYDLAVLKVEANPVLMASCAVAATVEDSNTVSVLDSVIAIGNPAMNGISATFGHVNVDSESITLTMNENVSSTSVSLRVMRIDAAVNSGNSGGGLFDIRGNLIGIVNAKLSSDNIDNIGYAIPSNVVTAVADNIIYYCDGTSNECVYRVILGISVGITDLVCKYDEESGKITKYETVIASAIDSTSVLNDQAKVGDIISAISINGKRLEVTRSFHVIDYMLNARVNDTVVVHLIRDGEALDVQINVIESLLVAYK